jgi:hypothetical protein
MTKFLDYSRQIVIPTEAEESVWQYNFIHSRDFSTSVEMTRLILSLVDTPTPPLKGAGGCNKGQVVLTFPRGFFTSKTVKAKSSSTTLISGVMRYIQKTLLNK